MLTERQIALLKEWDTRSSRYPFWEAMKLKADPETKEAMKERVQMTKFLHGIPADQPHGYDIEDYPFDKMLYPCKTCRPYKKNCRTKCPAGSIASHLVPVTLPTGMK